VAVSLSGIGGRVDRRPLRYQFAETRGERFDDNWLVIGGEIATASGAWSFTDPALLTAARVAAPAHCSWISGGKAGSCVATM
jgi:hypothetical protein